jgi:ankyrin repeat protein
MEPLTSDEETSSPDGHNDFPVKTISATGNVDNITFFPPFTSSNGADVSDGEDDSVPEKDINDSIIRIRSPSTDDANLTDGSVASVSPSPTKSMAHDELHSENDSRLRTFSSSVVEKGIPSAARGMRVSRSSSFSGARCSIPSQDQVQFHQAVCKRDYKKINNMLVETPRLVKCVDEFNRTPLHSAVELSDMASIEMLLQYNADVNAKDARSRSCIHLSSDAAVVRLLCEEGATVSAPDKNGYLPLHLFTIDGNKEGVKVLLEFGADPMATEPIHHRTSLHLAADIGDFELLSSMMLNSRVSLDVNVVDIEGSTPLHLVSMNSHSSGQQLRCIMLLLDKGANVNAVNKRGITALHYACGNRFFGLHSLAEPIIQVLLEMSADPNARDYDNCTPLIIACAHREWELCRVLFEAGGDMNIPCPMSSFMLQEGFGRDITAAGMIELEDCTASDLMQRQMRPVLFSSICVAQTEIPFESRDRCMNCANVFDDRSNSTSSFSFGLRTPSNGGRLHCRLCNRVTCQECTNKSVSRSMMPSFITEVCSERDMKLCNVCYQIIAGSSRY